MTKKTWFVMAEVTAYIDADSKEEAEEIAESMDMKDWELQGVFASDNDE